MTTIPVDLTVANVQMYLGTVMAVIEQEFGRTPDFENPDDSVAAKLFIDALMGHTVEDMRAYLRSTPEGQQRA